MRRPRRNHSAKLKAQVALEAIRGEKTIAEIAAHHEVHPGACQRSCRLYYAAIADSFSVTAAVTAGAIKGNANLRAKMTLQIDAVHLTHVVEDDIALG